MTINLALGLFGIYCLSGADTLLANIFFIMSIINLAAFTLDLLLPISKRYRYESDLYKAFEVYQTEEDAIERTLRQIERRLDEDPEAASTIVVGIAGRATSGKTITREKIINEVKRKLSNKLEKNNRLVIDVPVDDFLIPPWEREMIETQAGVFETEMLKNTQKALVEGRTVYKYLYDNSLRMRYGTSRERATKLEGAGAAKVREDDRDLIYDEETTQQLRAKGRISPISEIFIDVTSQTRDDRHNLIEKLDPKGHIIIHEGVMAVFNEEAVKGYTATLFIDADDITRLENLKLDIFRGVRYKGTAIATSTRAGLKLSEILKRAHRMNILAHDLQMNARRQATIVVNKSRPL